MVDTGKEVGQTQWDSELWISWKKKGVKVESLKSDRIVNFLHLKGETEGEGVGGSEEIWTQRKECVWQ